MTVSRRGMFSNVEKASASTLVGLAAVLMGCSACGKLADIDAGIDSASSTDGSSTDDSSSGKQETCGGGGIVVDAAPGTPKTITCPVGWHCDHNETSATAAAVCCPAGHTDHPQFDPACAYCSCPSGPNQCCPAGFSCASWDAAAPVCDGG